MQNQQMMQQQQQQMAMMNNSGNMMGTGMQAQPGFNSMNNNAMNNNTNGMGGGFGSQQIPTATGQQNYRTEFKLPKPNELLSFTTF